MWFIFFIANVGLHSRESLGLISAPNNMYHLVHSEGDFMTGLIVDVYTDTAAAMQAASSAYSNTQTPVVRRRRGEHGVPGGVEDPTVPVGNGVWILMLACLGYRMVRWRKKRMV